MNTTIIAAVDQHWGLGQNNQLLCHLPNDLMWFKNRTKHKSMLMGKNTALSLGKPLPLRINIVLSRQSLPHHLGLSCHLDTNWEHLLAEKISCFDKLFFHASSPEQGMGFARYAYSFFQQNNLLHWNDEVMIIGGGQLYRSTINFVNRIDLTHILHVFPQADVFFDETLLEGFDLVEEHFFDQDEKNPFPRIITQYKR